MLTAFHVFCIITLIILSVFDIRRGIIPNKIVYPAIILTTIFSLLSPQVSAPESLAAGAALAALLGGAGLLQGKMGMGDIKLAFIIGLMTGLPEGLIALGGGIILGGITAVLLLAVKLKGRKDEMVYGPYMAAGAILAIFFSGKVIEHIVGML